MLFSLLQMCKINPRLPNTLWGCIQTPKTYLKNLLWRYLEDWGKNKHMIFRIDLMQIQLNGCSLQLHWFTSAAKKKHLRIRVAMGFWHFGHNLRNQSSSWIWLKLSNHLVQSSWILTLWTIFFGNLRNSLAEKPQVVQSSSWICQEKTIHPQKHPKTNMTIEKHHLY